MESNRIKIREFISRFFRKHEIGDSDDIFSLGFVNSLFAMQLILFLEKVFDIQVPNEELNPENFKSIEAIDSFIESKLAN